jgi:hypothetical protein
MLIGSKLIPNDNCDQISYKIFKVEVCTDGYGDVNGDGYIDILDVQRASVLIGESIYLTSTQEKIRDGYIGTLELLRADVDGDGYVTANDVDLIQNFVNRSVNSFPAGTSFTHLCMTVQQNIGRYDGYHDCNGLVRLDGYQGINLVDPASLSTSELIYDGYLIEPTIDGTDEAFRTVPFVPVEFRIEPQPFWQPHFLNLSSSARLVPATFTYTDGVTQSTCSTQLTFECENRTELTPHCDPGRNDFFVPDNLIIAKGQILRPDGTLYKNDFEIGTVILELPQIPFENSSINLFDKFVADRGDGFTQAGFSAMRYADCSTVQPEDLQLGRVRFNVSIQSFVPNIDGYDSVDGYGIIVDDIIGVYVNHSTGILQLSIKDLSVDPVFMTLVTKIQVLVYLKKAGWNNNVLIVTPDEIQGLVV